MITLLSLYTACSVLPLILMIVMAIVLLVKKRSSVMLCTECQSCITHCPMHEDGANAFSCMLWAKTGVKDENFYQELSKACTRCGMCRRDCPRGLAPFELLPPKEKRPKKPSGASI